MIEVLFVALMMILVATFYYAYGLRGQLTNLQQRIAKSEYTTVDLNQDVVRRDKELTSLRQQLSERDALIESLRQLSRESRDVVRVGGEQTEKPENGLQFLQEQLAERDTKVALLTEEIAARARETLQSKALFNTISTVAYDLVFVLDEQKTIIAVNESAREFFGERNPIGDKLSDAIDSPELDDIIATAIENDDDMLEEQLRVNGDFYRVRTRFLKLDGEHVFIGIALQDITQLVKLNRARRDLVANISHELRTPIANIRLIIDSLFHEQDKPKRKDSISSLRAIADETDTLLWLVQELLDLSMIESGQAIMKMVETPLREVIEASVARLEDQLHNKKLSIAIDIPKKVSVLCDGDQSKRVLVNLVHNAIKWSPSGGKIAISATLSSDDVTISVIDEGPGVTEDARERIFERFYQVDASRSGGEGTGLGLAICKHIVEAQGGRIWAESNRQGGGGRFFFTLVNATPVLANGNGHKEISAP